jgi:hypothetical protein
MLIRCPPSPSPSPSPHHEQKFTMIGTKDNKSNAIYNELKVKYTRKPSGMCDS